MMPYFRISIAGSIKLFTAATLMLALFLLPCITTRAQSAKPRILMVVTSNNALNDGSPAGYYFPEAVDFYIVLKDAGYSVDDIEVVSPQGGRSPMYQRNTYLNYPPFRQLDDYQEFLAKFDNSHKPGQINPAEFSVIYYIGGFASLFDYPDNQEIASIAGSIYERGGIIAAVCHGPSGLLPIKLSNGRYLLEGLTITARPLEEETNDGEISRADVLYYFPFILEERLTERGATVEKGTSYYPKAMVDRRVVTGQNEYSSTLVAMEVLRLLENPSSGIEDDAGASVFSLAQNSPNPFSGGTSIGYAVAGRASVRLAVYNMMGEQVAMLVDRPHEQGRYEVQVAEGLLAPGTYFYRIESAGRTASRTMVVTR